MNALIGWTANQKEFLFAKIPFDGWDAALSGTFVLLLFLCLKRISLSKITAVLIVDQTGIYNLPTCKDGIVLLRNSPKIHLVDLIETLNPKTIIADGSNFPSFVRHWGKTAKDMGVDFHSTATEGAWIFNF